MAAAVELEKIKIPKRDKTGKRKHIPWAEAYTRHAVWLPVDRRPEIPAWPTGQGQRRWAKTPSGHSYPVLLEFFKDFKAKVPVLLQKPPQDEGEDQTYSGIDAREGEQRELMVKHRNREAKLRKAKIAAALSANRGRLICEVPRCGFDFLACYGRIGYGFAHVRHRKLLSKADKAGQKMTLGDLAIVCANCHSMIHRGGECRDLKGLIPWKRKELKPRSK